MNALGELLHSKIIFGLAEKGNKITRIDLSEQDILMPDTGLFVAIEWLVIDSNKYSDSGRDMETKKRVKYEAYAPLIGNILNDKSDNSWIYEKGIWSKVKANPDYDSKKAIGKYYVMAIELSMLY